MNHRSPAPLSTQECDQLLDWVSSGCIRRWRDAAGHTRRTASLQIGVDDSTLRRWEIGERKPQPRHRERAYEYYSSIKPEEEPCPPPPPSTATRGKPRSAPTSDAASASTA